MNLLRPSVHFTPQYGWMNDPNGAVYFQGQYHLFYQHNPHGLTWNHMHWGHAVSENLVDWKHLPIALYPDDMGDIFSGSCIVDKENISGLAAPSQELLLAYYTSHNMETKREQQCLAYSTDGVTFQKYEGNPILPGKDNTPARDPHVSRNPVLGGFTMCITTEKVIEFYHSRNLLDWEKTGEFALPAYAFQGMIECPCLFPVKVENSDALLGGETEEKYVLMMSMDIPETEYSKFPEEAVPHNRLMQYFVGSFDGKVFLDENPNARPHLVDYGADYYAGTIFGGLDEPVLIAWLGNAEKSMEIPTEKEGFRGIQSFPRVLSLVKRNGEYCLKHRFAFVDEKTGKVDVSKECNIVTSNGEVFLKREKEKVIFTDHCVREVIEKDGLIARTDHIYQ